MRLDSIIHAVEEPAAVAMVCTGFFSFDLNRTSDMLEAPYLEVCLQFARRERTNPFHSSQNCKSNYAGIGLSTR
jgi:hypothetical protein